MECLNNLVGYRGGCTPATYQLYVNDLTGITIESAEAATNSEQQSGFELIRQKINYAAECIKNDIRVHLKSKIRLDSLIESDVIGVYKDNLPTEAAIADHYRGIQFKIDDCPHYELHINSLRLQLQYSGDVDVKVWDLVTGKLIDTITATIISDDITEVVVNKSYKPFNRRINLLFTYSYTVDDVETVPDGYETSINKKHCCGAYRDWYNCGRNLYARAVKISTAGAKINSACTSISSTGGLSMSYSLNCSPEPLICSMGQVLAWPLLQKTGFELMNELAYSKRLNSIVTLHVKEHKELMEKYDFEYQKSMGDILKNIRLPKDICYLCDPVTRPISAIP